jgi:hypothetical protein
MAAGNSGSLTETCSRRAVVGAGSACALDVGTVASCRTANPAGTEQWLQLEKAARAAAPGAPAMHATENLPAVTFASVGALKLPLLLLTGDCDFYVSPAMPIYVARRLAKKRRRHHRERGTCGLPGTAQSLQRCHTGLHPPAAPGCDNDHGQR